MPRANSEFATIEDFVGEEVYIFTEMSTSVFNLSFGNIFINNYVVEIASYAADCKLNDDKNMGAIHGIIQPATYIPEDIVDIQVYVLVSDETGQFAATLPMSEGTTADTLANTISSLVSGFDGDLPIPIEQIFIVYGYELPVRLLVDEDDADDEKFEQCKRASAAAAGIKEAMEVHS